MRNSIRFVLVAIGLWMAGTTAVSAFEPMPPIMQTLLQVFPEKNGWFVDEPLGAVPATPDEAKPFFTCFRVIVPDLESLDKAIGRLMANAPKLPIKKITRYDREPGAPGLAGFRGIWCKTEDDSQVGFAIVTVNQNRFLLWAKQGYYPSLAVDSINAKVRDQYARDVSRYLAGVDAKVPDNEVPQAAGRMLPEWMDLYPPRPDVRAGTGTLWHTLWSKYREIRAWGISGVRAVVPTPETIEKIIASAKDTLWSNPDEPLIQHAFDDLSTTSWEPSWTKVLDKEQFERLRSGEHIFAVDRFGRIRYSECDESGSIPSELLFPGTRLLTSGDFTIARPSEFDVNPPRRLKAISVGGGFFFSLNYPDLMENAIVLSDTLLMTIGHFLGALRNEGIPVDDVLICKLCDMSP
jgi:hypothetical protein